MAPTRLPIDARVSLLDLLRQTLHLHGTKKGAIGACGAWTVLAYGGRILSGLSLAVQHEGRDITTTEGRGFSRCKRAFIAHAGFTTRRW